MTPALAGPSLASRWRVEISLVVATVALVAVTCMVNDDYLKKPALNAEEVLLQTAMLGIFALGAGIVILSGGIDLSSGSVIAFSGTICAGILLAMSPEIEGNAEGFSLRDTSQITGWMLTAAIGGTVLVALLIGTVHAWLITVVGLPPFVATLASLVGLRSLAKVLVQDVNYLVTGAGDSTQIDISGDLFLALGDQGTWYVAGGLFLLVALFCWVLLSRTVAGRHLYAMGGNEEAARLSGVRTERSKWLAYCIGSVTAAISGILYTAYGSSAQPATLGLGYELNAIAAAVVGGVSLAGGIGTVTGIALGAFFLRVVIKSVAKFVPDRPDDLEGLVVGLLLVLAVAFNELRGRGLLKRPFFPGALGLASVLALALLGGVCSMVVAEQASRGSAFWIGCAACGALLGAKAVSERLVKS